MTPGAILVLTLMQSFKEEARASIQTWLNGPGISPSEKQSRIEFLVELVKEERAAAQSPLNLPSLGPIQTEGAPKKRVLVLGCYDIMHSGHYNALRQVRVSTCAKAARDAQSSGRFLIACRARAPHLPPPHRPSASSRTSTWLPACTPTRSSSPTRARR